MQYIDPSGRERTRTLHLQRVETEDQSAEYYYDNEHGVAVRRSRAGTEVWEETDVNRYKGVITYMQPEVYNHPTAKSVMADLKQMMPDKFMKKHDVTPMQYTKLQELIPPPPPLEPPPEDKTIYMGADGRLGTADQLEIAEQQEGLRHVGEG